MSTFRVTLEESFRIAAGQAVGSTLVAFECCRIPRISVRATSVAFTRSLYVATGRQIAVRIAVVAIVVDEGEAALAGTIAFSWTARGTSGCTKPVAPGLVGWALDALQRRVEFVAFLAQVTVVVYTTAAVLVAGARHGDITLKRISVQHITSSTLLIAFAVSLVFAVSNAIQIATFSRGVTQQTSSNDAQSNQHVVHNNCWSVTPRRDYDNVNRMILTVTIIYVRM
jgi:hypothetical protein